MDFMKDRKRAAAGLAALLLFMAVCTVVSKGIYKSGLPRVTVCTPAQKNIIHKITATGTIKPGQEYGVYAVPGLRIRTIYVQTGDNVEEGNALFQIDGSDLEKMIETKELERKNILAQLQDQKRGHAEEKTKEQKAVSRLKEDYDRLVRSQDLNIERRRQEYYIAKQAREEAEEKTADTVSGGDSAPGLEALKNAERQAALSLEDAILGKETAILEWKRELEDAGEAEAEAAAELVRLQGQEDALSRELDSLYELKAQEGYVRAGENGTILESHISVGERTPDTACMLYASEDGEGTVELPLAAGDLKYLSIGDTVKLSYKSRTGETKNPEGVVQYLEKQDTGAVAHVSLSENGFVVGQNVTMEFSYQSQVYPMVIPAQALHVTELGGYFVYVVEEREGILGTEQCTRKINVEIIDQNGQYAALTNAAVTQDSLIVTGSTKELGENDVVRVIK